MNTNVDETQEVTNETADTAAQETATSNTSTEDAPSSTDDQESDIKAMLKAAREEAAANRVKARTTAQELAAAKAESDEFRQKLSALLGGESEETDMKVLLDQAIAERDATQKQLRLVRTENALVQAANRVGADSGLLVPLMNGLGELANLDPESDTFTEDVNTAVAVVLERYPHIKTVPQRTTAPTSGQPAESTPETGVKKLTRSDLQRLAAEGKWQEINKATAEGRIQY